MIARKVKKSACLATWPRRCVFGVRQINNALAPYVRITGFTNLWQASLGRPCARHFPCPRASRSPLFSNPLSFSSLVPGLKSDFSPIFQIQYSHIFLIVINFESWNFFFFCSIFHLESKDSRFKIFPRLFDDVRIFRNFEFLSFGIISFESWSSFCSIFYGVGGSIFFLSSIEIPNFSILNRGFFLDFISAREFHQKLQFSLNVSSIR